MSESEIVPAATGVTSEVDPVTEVGIAVRTKAKTRGRKVHVNDAFWSEIKGLYESGDYSQRQLSAFAKSRGIIVSQSAIARRGLVDGWMKAKDKEEIQNKALSQIHDALGNAVRDMLERHGKMTRALQQECLLHVSKAQKTRLTDPSHLIPANHLATLSAALDRLGLMEMRALGFDPETGRPVDHEANKDNDGALKFPELTVNVMSSEEEAAIRKALETLPDGE